MEWEEITRGGTEDRNHKVSYLINNNKKSSELFLRAPDLIVT